MVQYIPRNMHTVFALLCFVVVIHWLIFPYPSGLLHWHCGNLTIAPVPAKQPWWIRINSSCEFIMNDCITTTKQSTTRPCAYLLGYTVSYHWYMQVHIKHARRFVKICCVVVGWIILSYWIYIICLPIFLSRLLHYNWGKHLIAPVKMKLPWKVCVKLTTIHTQRNARQCKQLVWSVTNTAYGSGREKAPVLLTGFAIIW